MLRRDIEEQSSCKVVTAGESQCERDSERGWSNSADIRKMAEDLQIVITYKESKSSARRFIFHSCLQLMQQRSGCSLSIIQPPSATSSRLAASNSSALG